MNKVVTSVGTKVYYCFEATAGVRPTALSAYTIFDDCISHPNFNPEREQIETTTLKQTNNKTYTYGLKDFGVLEYGFNLTEEVCDLFLTASTGIIALAATNLALGKRMWIAHDIDGLSRTFFIPVEPQDFGLPEGTVNSKYELTIRFNPIDDGLWADDLTT